MTANVLTPAPGLVSSADEASNAPGPPDITPVPVASYNAILACPVIPALKFADRLAKMPVVGETTSVARILFADKAPVVVFAVVCAKKLVGARENCTLASEAGILV